MCVCCCVLDVLVGAGTLWAEESETDSATGYRCVLCEHSVKMQIKHGGDSYFTISVREGLVIPEEGKHLNSFNQIVGIKSQTSKPIFFLCNT